MADYLEADEFVSVSTYRDYCSWEEDVRYELINGTPHMMASPNAWHQRLLLSLGKQLADFLEGKTCQVFVAPFDVRLFPQKNDLDRNVVQPDVLVVCDPKKLADGKACKGAPDFIIEIMSVSSRRHDLLTKRHLYEKAGVREYWAVDEGTVYRYLLINGIYEETVIDVERHTGGGQIGIPIAIFQPWTLRL